MDFFRTKLASHLKPVAIVAILILQVQAVWVAYDLDKAITSRVHTHVDETALLASSVIDQRIVSVVQSLELLAEKVGKSLDSDYADTACDALLYRYKTTWKYEDLYLIAPDGSEIVRAVHDPKSEMKLAEKVFKTGRLALGKSSLENSIAYAIPVLKGGRVTAVLMAARGTELASRLLNVEAFGNIGIIMLVDHDRNIIVSRWPSSESDMFDKVNFTTSDRKFDTSPLGEDYAIDEHGHYHFRSNEADWVLSQRSKKEFGLSLIYAAPSDALLQKLPSLRRQNMTLTIISLLLLILLIADLLYLQHAYQKKVDEVELKDPLTRGDNAVSFAMKMTKILSRSKEEYALIAMDINKFKLINDEYGIAKANELLCLVHETLCAFIKEDELCARYDADVFILLLKRKGEQLLCDRLTDMMAEVMSRKHQLGLRHKHGLSSGVYIIRDRALSSYLMFDHANLARSKCKLPPHPSCVFYEDSMADNIRIEGELLNAFASSLEKDLFEVWLQPKVNLRTDIVAGAEALVRWNHPTLGFLYPGSFMQVLEQNGRIIDLDLWVFEQVCRMLARWDQEKREIIPIAVNLSRAHLANELFLNNYLKILQKYKINPYWIELELTEELFMEDEANISKAFAAIRSHGLRCAIDDFGTGYSSLSMLRNSNIDTVKLDRSFFVDELNDQSKALIRSITQLISSLGLTCVAEGVEDRATIDFLLTTEVTLVQGYFYSKPRRIADFESFVYNEENRRRLLNSGVFDINASKITQLNSIRGQQVRKLLSSLGEVGVHVVKKQDREILFCNTFLMEHSYGAEEGKCCNEVWTDVCPSCPLQMLNGGKTTSFTTYSKSFDRLVRISASECLWDGYIPAYIISTIPLSVKEEEEEERKKEELQLLRTQMADLKKKAQEDELTKLLSKKKFNADVMRRLETDRCGILMFIDLDGFKLINDTFGHLMGDVVLKNTSERIRLSFRKDDLIGRYGGDEFVVYVSNLSDDSILEERLHALQGLLRFQHTLDDSVSAISASIGVARFPQDADSFKDLVSKADLALYEAKRRGKDQHVYYSDTVIYAANGPACPLPFKENKKVSS